MIILPVRDLFKGKSVLAMRVLSSPFKHKHPEITPIMNMRAINVCVQAGTGISPKHNNADRQWSLHIWVIVPQKETKCLIIRAFFVRLSLNIR